MIRHKKLINEKIVVNKFNSHKKMVLKIKFSQMFKISKIKNQKNQIFKIHKNLIEIFKSKKIKKIK
jgi:hypothetical protein